MDEKRDNLIGSQEEKMQEHQSSRQAEPVHEPVTEPFHEPVSEPVPKPVTELVTEPVPKPVTEPVHDPEPTPAENESFIDKIKKRAGEGGIILLIITALMNIGKLGFLLQLFKFKTLFSMLIAMGAYALIFGLPFAAGIIVMLFVHETGHWLALRYYGVAVSSPIFIPFLGAAVFAKEMPKRVYHEAITASAGPAFGFLITIAFFVMGVAQQSGLFLALAYFSGFVNLFNLIPFGMLDGGRIAKALSRKIWIIGAVMLAALFIAQPNPFFLIILLLLGWGYFAEREQVKPAEYNEILFGERLIIAGIYLSVLLFLTVLTVLSYEFLNVVQPL